MCICSVLSCFIGWVSRSHMAAIFLWAAAILCGISFVSPFWLSRFPATAYIPLGVECPRTDIGLLAECCATEKCTWVWENGFHLEKTMEEWRRVIQFLFLTGLLLLLPVLVMSPFRFCCQCCKMSVGISRVFAIFTFLAACLFGSAALYFFYIIIWGELSLSQVLLGVNRRSWAFEVGVVGTCFTLASSVFWYLDSKRKVGSLTSKDQN